MRDSHTPNGRNQNVRSELAEVDCDRMILERHTAIPFSLNPSELLPVPLESKTEKSFLDSRDFGLESCHRDGS